MNNTITLQPQKGIIAIGAHPDDIELGCGASLVRLINEGYYVVAVVMTAGREGCNSLADRHIETQKALLSLGCHQVSLLHFEDTRASHFVDAMIKSLEDILIHQIPSTIEIIRAYTMHDDDRHQDHRAVYEASIVACRKIPQVLCYETPSTWLGFIPQVFENVTENIFSKKLQALSYHQSQQHRDYMRPERLRTVAQFRGQQAGCELGEGFIVHKMIL